jgi:hypothetical protein
MSLSDVNAAILLWDVRYKFSNDKEVEDSFLIAALARLTNCRVRYEIMGGKYDSL